MIPPKKQSRATQGAEARALERARDLPNSRTAGDPDTLKRAFADHLQYSQGKDEHSATALDRYYAVANSVRDRMMRRWILTQQRYYKEDAKRVYYLSLEFLMGKALENNLINLGLYENMRSALADLGVDLADLLTQEPDAGLGNGGLGRLAACFLDSLATLSIPAYGYGIRYEFGIFDQEIRNGYQVERPEEWLRFGNAWEIPRPEYDRAGRILRADRARGGRPRPHQGPLGRHPPRAGHALRHAHRRLPQRHRQHAAALAGARLAGARPGRLQRRRLPRRRSRTRTSPRTSPRCSTPTTSPSWARSSASSSSTSSWPAPSTTSSTAT